MLQRSREKRERCKVPALVVAETARFRYAECRIDARGARPIGVERSQLTIRFSS
jgi:hypothetical protein